MKITDIPQDIEPRVGDIIEIEQGEDCFEVRIIGITADGYLCEQDNVQGAVLLEGTALDHSDVADIMPLVEGLRDPKDNPCWKGYHPVGTKKKNGRTVPNCVPNAKESVEEAGPFSYGAKKPRRGSVAYNAMMKRREQEKNRPPIEPKDQMVGTAKLTKDVSEGSDQYYAIVHKVTGKPLSTHRDLESAKDEWRGLDQDQRHFFKVVTTNKAPKDWSMKEAVAETSDYFRRREREEAIISGQKPARKKQPAQTSDYARRREQEKKAEKGVAEGSGKNVVKSVKVGNFRHDLVDTGFGWQVRIYNGDELYDTGMSKNSEQKGLAALEDAVAYTEKQTRTKRQGVAEGYTGRETKDGTWRVFKDGNAVAVAGPFESREEAAAWIKKQKQGVAEGGWDGTRGWEKRNPLGSDRLPQDPMDRIDRMQAQTHELKQRSIERLLKKHPEWERSDLELASLPELIQMLRDDVNEAEYQGRKVALGKPMAGDVKKSKVYVRKPNGKVVKVNFGDKTMKIKKSNPKRRKSFRARHNCENPGPRWKARYWSCRAW